jgi:hypothetical protein
METSNIRLSMETSNLQPLLKTQVFLVDKKILGLSGEDLVANRQMLHEQFNNSRHCPEFLLMRPFPGSVGSLHHDSHRHLLSY